MSGSTPSGAPGAPQDGTTGARVPADPSGRATAGSAVPPVLGLSHVAIAVREADPLADVLVRGLGATRGGEELLDGGGLRVVFVRLGPVTLELLEPKSPEHTVAKFLDKRGPGLHHVSLEVPDVAAALERCRASGIEPIDSQPRAGAHGSRVAFLHPKSLGGVLFELAQAERPPDPGTR